METLVNTLEEFEAEAVRFITALTPSERATLSTLSGELGAGKTVFTKAVAKFLGVEEIVTSPTFVLEKIYPIRKLEDSRSNGAGLLGGKASKFKRLVHIDAYRLEQGSDLAPLGFDELMQDAGNLILLEWPEKVADVLPIPSAQISIVVNQNGSRTISYAP